MKNIGPLYVGKLEYYHRDFFPVVEKGWTQETDHPFRKGACLVFRFPKTHPGLYVGLWKKGSAIAEFDEDGVADRLAAALSLRDMGLTPDEIEDWDV
jgi:hypothetical protein